MCWSIEVDIVFLREVYDELCWHGEGDTRVLFAGLRWGGGVEDMLAIVADPCPATVLNVVNSALVGCNVREQEPCRGGADLRVW